MTNAARSSGKEHAAGRSARVRRAALRGVCAVVSAGLVWATETPVAAFVWPSESVRAGRALAQGDVAERRAAATSLSGMPEPVALPLLQTALADRDTDVRLRAARAAGQLHSATAASQVVEWLAEQDPRVRLAACELIRQVPTPRATAALGRVLGDPDANVRLAAVAAMGASGSTEAVGPLLGHVDDASPEVRAEVARALARIGDRAAALPLQGKMADSAPDVRRAVARALGELGDERSQGALVLALRDPVPAVRLEAVTALGRLRVAEAVPAMTPLLEERAAPEVRVAALAALGRIGSPAAVQALVLALAGDDPTAESAPAREALIASGGAAVAALTYALQQYDPPNVAAGAALALSAIRPAPAEIAALITTAMRRGTVSPVPGLRALAKLSDPSASPVVLELLADGRPFVRRQAIQTLNTLLDPERRDGRAIEPIASTLRDPRLLPDDREELVRALGRTGAPRALASLVPLATAPIVGLRMAALEALGALGPLNQDAVLLGGLGDEVARVRLQAALALAQAGGEKSVDALLARIGNEAAYDRTALGIALSGVLSRASERALPRIASVFEAAGPLERDALIEGLGRMHGSAAGAELATLRARTEGPADRRKIAEAVEPHAEQTALLTSLLRDADASVRAAAAWSAGGFAGSGAAPGLLSRSIELLADPEVAVAGNAVASVARLGAKLDASARSRAALALCSALDDFRAYVRANGLAGLALMGHVCAAGDRERALLLQDRSEVVRRAAARVLAARGARVARSVGVDDDARALARCAADDRSGSVAAACQQVAAPAGSLGAVSSLVFVIPDGKTLPQSQAPFSLQRADGLIRSGLTDRRGGLFAWAPGGPVQLLVPAALAL